MTKAAMLQAENLKEEIIDLYRPFTNQFRDFAAHELDRFAEYVFQASLAFRAGGHLVNLGSGTNAVDPLLRRMGMRVSVVDDFGDEGYGAFDLKKLLDGVHRRVGIEVHSLDFLQSPLPFEDESVDVITTYDSLEHWYQGVKHVMSEVRRIARPGARLIVGVPNAANLKKRVLAVLGRTQWTAFDEWYESTPFRGHVREPVAADLEELLRRNGFECEEILGRNLDLERRSAPSWAWPLDSILRLRPTMCSHLYAIGTRR